MDDDIYRIKLYYDSEISLEECLGLPSELYGRKQRLNRIIYLLNYFNGSNILKEVGNFKTIWFIRHAKSMFNERNIRHVDPLIWDAPLSEKGIIQAKHLSERCFDIFSDKNGNFYPELILVSPLTRTLQTAIIGLNSMIHSKIRLLADCRLRECLVDSDDHGQEKSILEKKYPEVDFSFLPENVWWHVSTVCHSEENLLTCWEETRYTEPEEEIQKRLHDLVLDLISYSAQNIVIVSHCGIIRRLTGIDTENTQIIPARLYI